VSVRRRFDTFLEQTALDVRHSVRALRNAPAFAAVAILSLALGIGANTAIFTIVNAVMLKALPVTEPERLVQLGFAAAGPNARTTFTNPMWEALRDRQQVFDGVFAFAYAGFDESEGGQRRGLRGIWVTGQFFETLGVRPWIGRLLTAADDRRGGGPDGAVTVISYEFWRDRYAAAPDALGRTIRLNGEPFTIVGVTPPGFFGVEVGSAFNVAVPLGCEPLVRHKDSTLDKRDQWWLRIIGRMKGDGQHEHERDLQSTLTALEALRPAVRDATIPPEYRLEDRARYLKEPFTLMPASTGTSYLRRQYRAALFTLLAVVGLVLLIACANLANLLLARATARQKEFAVRLALGASRPRLVRQLLIESLLLAIAGAGLGMLLAQSASRLLVRQLTPATETTFPIVLDLTMDWRVLGFTAAAALVTAVLFGLAPAFRSTDLSANALMKSGTRSIASGWTRFNLEKLLIASQIALSLVLVLGASLFVRSFASLATLDPGFTRDRVMLVDVNIRRANYPPARRLALYDQMGQALRGTPGVQSLAAATVTPISGFTWSDTIEVAGFVSASERDKNVHKNSVGAGYFKTLGTAIRAGRDFDARDTLASPRVAIVNETLARKFFPGKNAIGQHYKEHESEGEGWRTIEIVGVVQDSKYEDLREVPPPTAYVPLAQKPLHGNTLTYLLRASVDPRGLGPSLSRAIADVNKDVTFDIGTLDEQIDASLIQERLLAMLAGFFGALALLVAGIGLYGVMWLAMTRRRNEIGIRMALGAQPGGVIRMMLREVATLTLLGLIAGAAIAMATGQLVTKLLFGLTPTDAGTWMLAVTLLAIVAALAGYLPARRASRVDPMIALREE
jgi:putative ABC transport system permease protein